MSWGEATVRLKRGLSVVSAPEKWMYEHGLRSTERLTLPDFIGIGMARSGTTWVYRNLREHPDVQRRRSSKELAYFNNHFGRPLRSYAENFRDGSGLRFEITPGYAHLPSSRIRFMRAIMPDVKLLVLFREPMAQAWSETVRRLVKRPRRSFEDVDPRHLASTLRSVVQAMDYVDVLERWQGIYPEDQLLVGFFDDVVSRPRQLLEEIFVFLDLTTDIDWHSLPFATKANENPPTEIPEACRAILAEAIEPRIEPMRQRFGPRVDPWFEPA